MFISNTKLMYWDGVSKSSIMKKRSRGGTFETFVERGTLKGDREVNVSLRLKFNETLLHNTS